MFSVIIQAGGKSKRMGQDKALLRFLGEPLISRIVRSFTGLGQELLVITNQPDEYGFLGLPLFTDVIPGRGALGGLYTALEIASGQAVGLVACDLPFASPDLLAGCRDLLINRGVDAVIPTDERGLQPLHAVYRKAACLPLVKEAIEQDRWKMISWHDDADVLYLPPDETFRLTGSPHTFLNINTPEEFQAAEDLARQLENQAG